jgi:hypothetical protein
MKQDDEDPVHIFLRVVRSSSSSWRGTIWAHSREADSQFANLRFQYCKFLSRESTEFHQDVTVHKPFTPSEPSLQGALPPVLFKLLIVLSPPPFAASTVLPCSIWSIGICEVGDTNRDVLHRKHMDPNFEDKLPPELCIPKSLVGPR